VHAATVVFVGCGYALSGSASDGSVVDVASGASACSTGAASLARSDDVVDVLGRGLDEDAELDGVVVLVAGYGSASSFAAAALAA
jgi:hypothetical protein